MSAFDPKRTFVLHWRMSLLAVRAPCAAISLAPIPISVLGFPTSAGEGVAAQLTCDKIIHAPVGQPVSKGVLEMTSRFIFQFLYIEAVSFLTLAAISSVVLAGQGPVAACAPDIQAQCAGHANAEGRMACIKTTCAGKGEGCRQG